MAYLATDSKFKISTEKEAVLAWLNRHIEKTYTSTEEEIKFDCDPCCNDARVKEKMESEDFKSEIKKLNELRVFQEWKLKQDKGFTCSYGGVFDLKGSSRPRFCDR